MKTHRLKTSYVMDTYEQEEREKAGQNKTD